LNLLCTIKISHHSKISKKLSSKDIAYNRNKLLKKSLDLHDEITNLLNNFSEYVEPEMPYLDFAEDENGDVKSQFDFYISKLNYFKMIRDESSNLCDDLYKFISMMEILIGNESHCLSKGRKNLNRDRFYTQIAELFRICLAEPTKSKDGDFAIIVGIVNELLGLREEGQDPSRAVNKAVDDLRNKLAKLAEWSS
jgi:hypothetical protein